MKSINLDLMSGRHDSRKRGRSRSPDRRSGRSVSSKSRSRNDDFKIPEPKTAEDKLSRILQAG